MIRDENVKEIIFLEDHHQTQQHQTTLPDVSNSIQVFSLRAVSKKNIYSVNSYLGAALQWNPTGVIVAGNGTYGNTPSQLYYPMGVYVDPNNAIYVADYDNHRVQKWLPNAVSGTTVAGATGTCGSGSGLLCNPNRIYGDSKQKSLYC